MPRLPKPARRVFALLAPAAAAVALFAPQLARVLDFFASRGVDRVAQVGDFVDGMGSDAE